MKKILFIIFIGFIISCKKNRQEERWFEAKVLNTADQNCGEPVLWFQPADSIELCNKTGYQTLTYISYSLEDAYNYVNNIVYVQIGTIPEAWVGPPCFVSGPFYPNVWLSNVRQK